MHQVNRSVLVLVPNDKADIPPVLRLSTIWLKHTFIITHWSSSVIRRYTWKVQKTQWGCLYVNPGLICWGSKEMELILTQRRLGCYRNVLLTYYSHFPNEPKRRTKKCRVTGNPSHGFLGTDRASDTYKLFNRSSGRVPVARPRRLLFVRAMCRLLSDHRRYFLFSVVFE